MDTDSFIVYIKTEYIYINIAKDVETRFDTTSYELERPLTKAKNTKSNWINDRRTTWKNNGKVFRIKT